MPAPNPERPVYRDGFAWNLGLSAFWFATNWKWFLLLLVVLPGQVAEIVPQGERNGAWGVVFAIGATWAIIGPSIFGNLSDKLRRRKPFIVIGALGTAVALIVLMNARSLVDLTIGYLFLQVCDDIAQGAYTALIPQLVPPERRGRSSAIMSMLLLVAQIVGASSVVLWSAFQPFGLTSLQLIYLSIAGAQIVCGGLVVLTLRDLEEPFGSPPAVGAKRSWVSAWLSPWRSSDFRVVWFARFSMAIASFLLFPYLRNYLTDVVSKEAIVQAAGVTFPTQLGGLAVLAPRTGLKAQPVFDFFGSKLVGSEIATLAIALTVSLIGAGGALIASQLTDRVGRKAVVRIGIALMMVAMIPFALVPIYSLMYVLGIIFGLGYGLYMSADWALAADVVPNPEELGKDMGIWNMSTTSVQIFTGIAGLAIDTLNRNSLGSGYTAAILVAVACMLATGILVQRIRGTT